METANEEEIYCADHIEYRVFCDVFDKFAIDRYYNSHLKSSTHSNNNSKRQQSSN